MTFGNRAGGGSFSLSPIPSFLSFAGPLISVAFAFWLHVSVFLKNCLSQFLHALYERLFLQGGGFRPWAYVSQ